jgi:hypothetical protein
VYARAEGYDRDRGGVDMCYVLEIRVVSYGLT